jgi:transcriptional regulator with XRE-family HTH domain
VNTADKLIGQNIRANRLSRGLTQKGLADKIGVTFQQVQKYEEGANGARGSRLVQIAKALDVPILELFKGVGPTGQTAPVNELSNLVTNQHSLRMLRAFSRIERPALQRALVKLAEEIASEGATCAPALLPK